MKSFNDLDQTKQNMLLKFPAYISLLAANADGTMSAREKKEAEELTHIKTFTSEPLLADFYKAAEKVFPENIEELDKQLPKEKAARENAIKKELIELSRIMAILGRDYSLALHKSIKSYTDHVSKVHNNVLSSFIIPLSVKGITE